MTADLADGLRGAGFRGEILREEPLARHTTWRIGGRSPRLKRAVSHGSIFEAFRGNGRALILLLRIGSRPEGPRALRTKPDRRQDHD